MGRLADTVGFKVEAGNPIGDPACPLMTRWLVATRFGSVRLHHFHRPDADRHLHTHPWWFLTLVLKGGYRDVTACPMCGGHGLGTSTRFALDGAYTTKAIPGTLCWKCGGSGRVSELVSPGHIRFRRAQHTHAVDTTDSWSLVVTGPLARDWGFAMPDGSEMNHEVYHAAYGVPDCAGL